MRWPKSAQLITTPAAKMAETLQVQLLPHTQVRSLDTLARTLSYDDAAGQSHSLGYGDLVLATGADPIRLPMAGSAAAQVQSINHLDDLQAVRRHKCNPSIIWMTWPLSMKR